jgi:putative addiction module component (TIGR02574 family)
VDHKRVFQDALQLPVNVRAAVAAELISSLDEEVDVNAEALWADEIRKRVDEIKSGAVRTVPWAEADNGS